MPHLPLKTKAPQTPHPSEISVVLTGKAGPLTQNVITSVRRFLPGARLIFCSWKPDASAFAPFVDECLTPDEPPALWPGPMLNANKQLVAVQTALDHATTPFCLKLRTDTVLTRAAFVRAFMERPARDPAYSIFGERIVISNLFTINPRRPALVQRNLSFHPSDIAMFGLTNDIRRFWSAPLLEKDPPSPEFASISPEQYFFIHAIRSADHRIDYTSWMVDPGGWGLSERYLVANFHVLSSQHFGFVWPRPLTPINFTHIYSSAEWRSMMRNSTAGKNRLPCSLSVFIKELANFIYLHGGPPLAALRTMWHTSLFKRR